MQGIIPLPLRFLICTTVYEEERYDKTVDTCQNWKEQYTVFQDTGSWNSKHFTLWSCDTSVSSDISLDSPSGAPQYCSAHLLASLWGQALRWC